MQFSHFTSAKGARNGVLTPANVERTRQMVLCLAVVPEAYLLNFNTERDYQTEVKSGSGRGPYNHTTEKGTDVGSGTASPSFKFMCRC